MHGGVGTSRKHTDDNFEALENGMKEALEAGYKVLKKNSSALRAVEEAVKVLEDNPHFNAGRGSALNSKGEVEMDASIMDGKTLHAGAVSMVRNIKNPISLAKLVMEKTNHVFLSGYGAVELAKSNEYVLEPDAYFITDFQNQEFLKLQNQESMQKIIKKKMKGTVGSVAVDKKGNLAAATSTGGTSNCLPGRIGDSCVIGSGCYANNDTCAVSGTGHGEVLITGVVAHSISMVMEFKKMSMQEACDYVLHVRNKLTDGDIGVIAVNGKGEIGISHKSEMMKYGWIDVDGNMQVHLY